MQFHRGRLFDYIHLRVADLEASKRFYRAILEAIGGILIRTPNVTMSALTKELTTRRSPTYLKVTGGEVKISRAGFDHRLPSGEGFKNASQGSERPTSFLTDVMFA